MVDDKILQRIYKDNSEGVVLTTGYLASLGVNQYDITKLLSSKKLVRVKMGVYELSFEKQEQIKLENQEKEQVINKENYRNYFHDCLHLIKDGKFEDAFKTFETVMPYMYYRHSNFYLYLFGMLIDLPEQYREKVRRFEFNDIHYISQTEPVKIQNMKDKERSFVFQKKFNKALEVHKELLSVMRYGIYENLTFYLINAAKATQQHYRKKVVNYVVRKDYYMALKVSQIMQNRNLDAVFDNSVYMLLSDINWMLDKNKAVDVSKGKADDTITAIEKGNYDLAQNLYDEMHEKKGVYFSYDILDMLLYDVNSTICLFNEDYKNKQKYKEISRDVEAEAVAKKIIAGQSKHESGYDSLDGNQKSLAAIAVAEGAYTIENYTLGDEYLRSIPVKTERPTVKRKVREVIINKEMYKSKFNRIV